VTKKKNDLCRYTPSVFFIVLSLSDAVHLALQTNKKPPSLRYGGHFSFVGVAD
jgi:hypothetical protein